VISKWFRRIWWAFLTIIGYVFAILDIFDWVNLTKNFANSPDNIQLRTFAFVVGILAGSTSLVMFINSFRHDRNNNKTKYNEL
jgi:uncharacterized membrane protein HdeD (DUF308 family)